MNRPRHAIPRGPERSRAAEVTACCTCRHFVGDPRVLEASLPGFRSLGSADGSARSSDGICILHGYYLSSLSRCAEHDPTLPAPHAAA